MRHACLLLLLLWALVAPLGAQAAPAWTLREDGFGPLRVGMTVPRIARLVGQALDGPEAPFTEACTQTELPGHPGVVVMIEDGRLTRLDLLQATLRTQRGLGIGDPVSAVQMAYGRALRRTPRAYRTDDELSLTHRSRSGQQAIRFDTLAGRIDAVHAGRWRSVQYSEGCL